MTGVQTCALPISIFHNKLKKYLTNVILQHPDTFIYETEYLIGQTKNDSDMFKYIVWFSVYASETSNIVGMDAAFVHLAKQYYLSGKTWWLDAKRLKTITERVEKLDRILIGKVAPELRLWDTNEVVISMHSIDADYLILAFWEYDCGHCKTSLPKLRELYQLYQEKGVNVKVYAVCTKKNKKKWKQFINEKNLDFINVNGAYHIQYGNRPGYVEQNPHFYDLPYNELYNVISTPKMFLLDKDKKILSKRLEPEQMFEFIDRDLKKKEKKKKKGK